MTARPSLDLYREHACLVTEWTGTALAPVAESAAATVEVWVTTPTENGILWEALNAQMVTEDSARICAVPTFVYGLHYGDTVGVIASAEGALVVTSILARGGCTTFRVWLGDNRCRTTWQSIAETYARRGCLIDLWSERLLSLSCDEKSAAVIRGHLSRESVALSFTWEPGTRTDS